MDLESSGEAFGTTAFGGGASVTPLVDGYHRGARKAMAKALPCVSPHNDARVELPQAYVVSGLCASHYAVILQTSRCLSLVIAI